MKKLILLLALFLFTQGGFAQSLGLDDLISIIKMEYVDVNNKLTNKGWNLGGVYEETDSTNAVITWSYGEEEKGKAQKWVVYTFTEYAKGYSYTQEQLDSAGSEGVAPNILVKTGGIHNLRIKYVTTSIADYNQILAKAKAYKMKPINSAIANNVVASAYEGANYVLTAYIIKGNEGHTTYELFLFNKEFYYRNKQQ